MIVGIDPGTTVGCAVLDCSGSLIKLYSEKHMNLNSVISKVIKMGKPVAVACDVKKAPHFIEKFSAKTRAKLVAPDKDLLQRDKEILTEDFRKIIKNNHQRSALAAALHAYGMLEPLLVKIMKKLARKDNIDIFDDVAAMVLTRNISIQRAQEKISSKLI